MLKTVVNNTKILQVFYDQFNRPHHIQPGESKSIDVEAPVEEETITITAGARKILISELGKKPLTLIIQQGE